MQSRRQNFRPQRLHIRYLTFYILRKLLYFSGSFRRGMLRGSTPRLLHMFTENVFPDGWGVEPHIALQTETTRSEREFLLKSNADS